MNSSCSLEDLFVSPPLDPEDSQGIGASFTDHPAFAFQEKRHYKTTYPPHDI